MNILLILAQPSLLNVNVYQIMKILYCNSTDVNSKFHFHTITETNILKNLKNLKVSKATRVDGIPAKMLKLSCDIIAPSLTYIFNLSIFTGAC